MNETTLTGVVWELRKVHRTIRGRVEQDGFNFALRWVDELGNHQEVECEAWEEVGKQIHRHGEGAEVVLSCRPRGGKNLTRGAPRGRWSIFTVTGVVAATPVDRPPEREYVRK